MSNGRATFQIKDPSWKRRSYTGKRGKKKSSWSKTQGEFKRRNTRIRRQEERLDPESARIKNKYSFYWD